MAYSHVMSDYSNISIFILAAGKGSRMRSSLPKVMHKIGDYPMIGHVIKQCEALSIQKISVIVGPEMQILQEFVAPYPTIIQEERLGTGHAIKIGLPHLSMLDDSEYVCVLYGDTPFINSEVLDRLFTQCHDDLSVVAFEASAPHQYGRLIVEDHQIVAIIEDKDCDEQQKTINLANSGIMKIRMKLLRHLLPHLNNNNNQGEYYLTDLVKMAHEHGYMCGYMKTFFEVSMGVNSPQELIIAEALFQQKKRSDLIQNLVSFDEPTSVHFSYHTYIEPHVHLEPYIVFKGYNTVAEGSLIKSFSHIENATIAKYCTIGPYARLREGSVLDDHVKIGNFVETKKTHMHQGAKANHLSYLGDADIGKNANIGAGTITCNYDGVRKHSTKIGEEAFIGSNSSLVAPLEIGEHAIIGAGSTIRKNVAKDDLALSNHDEKHIQGKARSLRSKVNKKV